MLIYVGESKRGRPIHDPENIFNYDPVQICQQLLLLEEFLFTKIVKLINID